jgi:hydrogen cyanide synthase HcnC
VKIVIVGAGAFGSVLTYILSKRGCEVTLIDKDLPGRATSASAGGLWPVGESIGLGCGVIFHALNQDGTVDAEAASVGPEPLPRIFMEFLVESSKYFPQLAHDLEKDSGLHIETEVDTGLLYVVYNSTEQSYADGLLEWLSEGDTAVEEWSKAKVLEREPLMTQDQLGGIYFPGDNQVNPLRLADACMRAATRRGAKFVSDTAVTGVTMDGALVTGVETERGHFDCDVLVNAAGAWSGQLAKMLGIDIPIVPVRGQILCTEALRDQTLKCNLSTSDCYLLQKAHGEIIIGSTTEMTGFDVDVPLENLGILAAGAKRAIPALEFATVKRSWSGLRPGTPDEFPILGPVEGYPNYFNATGGFRTGIVAAPLSAEIVAAQILGEKAVFDPEPFMASRFNS